MQGKKLRIQWHIQKRLMEHVNLIRTGSKTQSRVATLYHWIPRITRTTVVDNIISLLFSVSPGFAWLHQHPITSDLTQLHTNVNILGFQTPAENPFPTVIDKKINKLNFKDELWRCTSLQCATGEESNWTNKSNQSSQMSAAVINQSQSQSF